MHQFRKNFGNTVVSSYQKKIKRTYNALTAANLSGYISEVNKSEVEKNSYYEIGEMIGRQVWRKHMKIN